MNHTHCHTIQANAHRATRIFRERTIKAHGLDRHGHLCGPMQRVIHRKTEQHGSKLSESSRDRNSERLHIKRTTPSRCSSTIPTMLNHNLICFRLRVRFCHLRAASFLQRVFGSSRTLTERHRAMIPVPETQAGSSIAQRVKDFDERMNVFLDAIYSFEKQPNAMSKLHTSMSTHRITTRRRQSRWDPLKIGTLWEPSIPKQTLGTTRIQPPYSQDETAIRAILHATPSRSRVLLPSTLRTRTATT